MPRRRGGGDMAVDLGHLDPRGQIGHGLGRAIAGLALQRRPIDGPAVQPRRRPGLEPPQGKAQAVQGRRQPQGRRLADAPRRRRLGADMDQAAEEGAGGQHRGAAGQDLAGRQANPGQPVAMAVWLDDQILDRPGPDLQPRLFASRACTAWR